GQTFVRTQDLRWALGKAVLLNAGLAFIVVFVLFWVGEAAITTLAPKEDLEAGKTHLASMISNIPSQVESNRDPVVEGFRAAPFKQLLSRLDKALAKTTATKEHDGAVAEDLKNGCGDIKQKLSAELNRGNILVPSSCNLHEEVTRDLGEGRWL